ncbi:type II secretion system F family protein [Parahaliea aestuarii]|uniref:Type II secretion system protein GspF domain-containing protein n=1 Tax=Parahaliea aestuarii TaxID=1852021 RepID=A0A5C8ZNT6_9GAMM|nr:type II secretion system F family protein [Parahaliea aestuarii]TXS89031.1 hypothetical protein FVW59_19085 [Parahaliea aestuarii]
MATYHYSVINQGGSSDSGVIDAESEQQARQELRSRGMTILKLRPAGTLDRWDEIWPFRKPYQSVSRKNVAAVLFQLGTMLKAGVTLEQALKYTAINNKSAISRLCYDIRSRVLEGESLAAALTHHKTVANTLVISSIRAGEQSGSLDTILISLSEYLMNLERTLRTVKSALTYPMILLTVAVAVVMLLMINIVPGFVEVFDQNEQPLPPLTLSVLQLTLLIQEYWILMLVSLAGAVAIFSRILKRKNVSQALDRLVLKIPLLRSVVVIRSTQHIAYTLYILTHSGVHLIEALRICSEIPTNSELQRAVRQAGNAVEQGKSLGVAFSQTSVFPPLFVQFIESGEASGQLDAMLKQTAGLLDDEANSRLATLAAMAEPLALLLVAAIVFTVVMAVLQPIFQMNTLF